MPWEAVLAFWLVCLLLVVVPGADWAFTLAAGLRGATLAAVCGLATGYLAVTAVVATGVGALVAASPTALTSLTLVGASYLIWRGVTALREQAAPAPVGRHSTRTDSMIGTRFYVTRGVGVSGLNPKGLLILLSLLPQFTDPVGAWPVTGQILALGVVFVATCTAFYLVLGTLATRLAALRPATARVIDVGSGIGMVAVGVLLLVGHVIP